MRRVSWARQTDALMQEAVPIWDRGFGFGGRTEEVTKLVSNWDIDPYYIQTIFVSSAKIHLKCFISLNPGICLASIFSLGKITEME